MRLEGKLGLSLKLCHKHPFFSPRGDLVGPAVPIKMFGGTNIKVLNTITGPETKKVGNHWARLIACGHE